MANLALINDSLVEKAAEPTIAEQLRAIVQFRVIQLSALTALLAGIGSTCKNASDWYGFVPIK